MILVVDHDPEVLETAREILNHDRQVFLASTASQAFSMVERLGFSVVLVDLELPGNAYTLIQKLHDAYPDLLIIAIISGAMKASVFEATKDLGVVEVLKKPITPEWKPVVERIRARRANRDCNSPIKSPGRVVAICG
jgi:CheY-like chemotaxis protein